MSARRATTALVASSLVAAGLAISTGLAVATAAPAFAKSSVELRGAPHSVPLGARIHLSAFGASDDFGGDAIRLCVDERVNDGHWRLVGCGAEGAYRTSVRATERGTLAFRAQLLATVGHHHYAVDRTSATAAVHVA
ncbi:hypothetical protein [Streptacidiphilus fuscans]|uniref:Secreted protein n=1 Tax=Streptacidiphilus fuscans TaxID=2789292 RepID=A0A931FFR7_9ACTN|nr:hypothetical protein [Streptacidiphilus fuscans]MBF9070565.1 hypothetical protein [Streptacidiphilus fuscans]